MYPLATLPSRVVRVEEAPGCLWAEKGAFQNFVTFLCTSGKKGTRAGRYYSVDPTPGYQSSSLEGSGHSGRFHLSPTCAAARESMTVSSGSDSNNVTLPEGGHA